MQLGDAKVPPTDLVPHGGSALMLRIAKGDEPPCAARPWVVRFSYAPPEFGGRICVTFASVSAVRDYEFRWRTVAMALWRMARRSPKVRYRDVQVDVSDSTDGSLPADVLRFVRRPGDPHRLIPNPYLLSQRRRWRPARPWILKSHRLFFRGSATGSSDFNSNARVALCRAAKDIPNSDCKITGMQQVDSEFVARCRDAGILAGKTRAKEMNRHRFLADADGNTSSWDRYFLSGYFHGLPIRFETGWEECWHGHLIDGENFVHADRHTLAAVMDRLRSRPRDARQVASSAARLAATVLSQRGTQGVFEAAWKEHATGLGKALGKE